jgi:hypothetical protein
MATQANAFRSITTAPAADYVLLRRVLFADTVLSAGAGLAMALFSRPIEEFLGGDQPDVLMAIGIVLVLFAAFNFTTARETPLNRTKAWIIFEFNVVWVIASLVALAANIFDLNTTGNLITLLVALNTAGIAALQWLGLRRA